MLDGIKTNPQEFSAFSKNSYILSKTTLFGVLGFRVLRRAARVKPIYQAQSMPDGNFEIHKQPQYLS
jgi:hypothetical protein